MRHELLHKLDGLLQELKVEREFYYNGSKIEMGE